MVEGSGAQDLIQQEEVSRREVETARTAYFEAVEHVRQLARESSGSQSPECGFDLVRAHRQETAARNEYMRLLKGFTELLSRRDTTPPERR